MAIVVLALVAGAGVWALASRDDDRAVTASAESPALGSGGSSGEPGPEPPGTDRVVIEGGSASDRSQKVMRAAIADVDGYWRVTYPRVFDGRYVTVEGGFHAVDDGQTAPCSESPDDVQGNAYYCPGQDLVAWDADGLVPYMVKTYGPLGLGLVVAHEWGHAIQARAQVSGPTVFVEQQADCFAGAWVDHVRDQDDPYFRVDGNSLDLALAGFLELRDAPGSSAASSQAHGTAFDRIRAFQEGVEGGAEACAAYTVDNLAPKLTDIRFTTQDDLDSGGNLPLQQAFDLTVADLTDFWTRAWSELGGTGTFAAPELKVFSKGEAPRCPSRVGLSGEVFFCPATNVLAVQDDGLAVELHDRIGDFALGEVLGSGYSLSALHQLGDLGKPSARTTRAADCLAGVWSASVFTQNRQGAQLQLSPGDLDEAVAALLATADQSKGSVTGTGADRVAAYRSGFMDGFDACGP